MQPVCIQVNFHVKEPFKKKYCAVLDLVLDLPCFFPIIFFLSQPVLPLKTGCLKLTPQIYLSHVAGKMTFKNDEVIFLYIFVDKSQLLKS